ncbi:MAG: cyclic nucleotide-binding domain-containing protein [Leptospiraceae bacterium]|nr:cyclic nucleotide-binding domain-containing protein [Leptospiraceae bacterium]MCB1317981.1 cyclic nucleotide-binding domain-containing protein [Leptospiraceae bacterium]MCB1318708.1 cyclic nucleotide-binding domain-containing protein [Leptospiraceae bacterium]
MFDTEPIDKHDLLKLGFEGERAITAELFLKYGKTFGARQIIIREGEFGREVYMIISGKVVVTERLQKGSYKVLNSLGPGEIFGEMALIEDAPRSATLIAATSVKLLQLTKDEFETIFKSHPRWALKILTALGKRILTGFQHVENHYGGR